MAHVAEVIPVSQNSLPVGGNLIASGGEPEHQVQTSQGAAFYQSTSSAVNVLQVSKFILGECPGL